MIAKATKRKVGKRRSMRVNLKVRQWRQVDQPHRVPPSLAGPKCVFLSCHYCAYSPSELPAGGVCPKCGSHSWERFTVSRHFLPAEPAKKP